MRITKYVAQENMEPVSDCRIVHRALDNFFLGYSPALGRYIPSRKLQVGRGQAGRGGHLPPVWRRALLLPAGQLPPLLLCHAAPSPVPRI